MFRIILIIIGGILLFVGGGKYLHSEGMLDWNYTSGTVEFIDIDPAEGTFNYGKNFNPIVRYSYDVNEKKYEGKFNIVGLRNWADYQIIDMLDGYKKGGIVKVYYDPKDPQHSVLEREVSYSQAKYQACFFILLGFFIVIIGFLSDVIIPAILKLIYDWPNK